MNGPNLTKRLLMRGYHIPYKPALRLLAKAVEEEMMICNSLSGEHRLELGEEATDEPVDRKEPVGIYQQALITEFVAMRKRVASGEVKCIVH